MTYSYLLYFRGTGQVLDGDESEVGKQGAFPLVCVTENNSRGSSNESSGGKDDSPPGSVRWSSSTGHAA